jgi:MoaA/NifB/PqqE/SkfB family radical SAM enzyme
MKFYEPRILYHRKDIIEKGLFDAPRQPEIYINDIKLFSNIQIQTIEFCNLKCDFCPNHYIIWDRIEDKKKGIAYNTMSVENYTKIVKELANLGYKGRFSPYLMNEPLIDKDRIVEFIRIAREYLPECFIQMDSNGTGLTKELMRDMIDAGLNRIQLDDYFDDRYAQRMLDIMKHFQDDDVNIILSSNYNVDQVKKKEDKNKKEHYGPWTYWNRGGLVNVNPDIPVPQKDCGYPSDQIYIKWDGDALLCCCDWEYQVVHGNVLKTSIKDVWTNESYEHYRKTLKKGRRDLLQMCRKCNKGGCVSNEERGIARV